MSTMETPEKPASRLMRQNYQAKIGERLMQAGMMAKGRALAMWSARKTVNGTLGESNPSADAILEDDEAMQIRVGDETHHYYHEAPASDPAAVSTESAAPASGLSKLALAAALTMGSGGLVGIGAAIPLVLDALKPLLPPPIEIPAPVDTDTRNTFTLS